MVDSLRTGEKVCDPAHDLPYASSGHSQRKKIIWFYSDYRTIRSRTFGSSYVLPSTRSMTVRPRKECFPRLIGRSVQKAEMHSPTRNFLHQARVADNRRESPTQCALPDTAE